MMTACDYRAQTSLLNSSQVSDMLAQYAVQALLDEVHTTPKPGLVDQRNNGAHKDMDLQMFERSAHALAPYFREVAVVSMSEKLSMPYLQQLGIEAEESMYRVTGGVNTHKGAIFALGLLVAATGECFACGGNLFSHVSDLASMAAPAPEGTHGDEVNKRYHRYRRSGARTSAILGFPAAQLAYRLMVQELESAVDTLIHLMATLDDTNLLYRGGIDGLLFAQRNAREIIACPTEARENRILELDDEFIRRNLSPGGSADMLAAGFYLKYTDHLWLNSCDSVFE